jgi:hypothetical protein
MVVDRRATLIVIANLEDIIDKIGTSGIKIIIDPNQKLRK